MKKWIFCGLWLLSMIVFFAGQSFAPSNYSQMPNNLLWVELFGLSIFLGFVFFCAMIAFIILEKNEKNSQKGKIRCICGILFIPEEEQTHCNYCGTKISDIDKKKINHKRKSKKNIKTIEWKTPKRFLTILLGLAILFSAGLYVRAENIEKELRNKDFKSKLEPTPTILQTTPTLKPKAKEYVAPTPTSDPDPIIDCKSSNQNCKGSSIRVRRSQCSKITCCQIGNSWSVYPSNEKCDQAQGDSGSHSYNPPASYPPCTIYYPALGYSQTYNYLSSEQCEQSRKSLTVPVAPVVLPTPTINQSAIDEYNQLLKDHQAACNQAAAEWIGIREQFEATQFNNYSSSAEAVMALQQRMAQYQQELYDAGCSNRVSL